MIKELQNTCNQISEHVHKISFNFYKSCDSKLEDLKTSFDRSMQSLGYNLTHAHRDIKEAKEDVTYMKNKVFQFKNLIHVFFVGILNLLN